MRKNNCGTQHNHYVTQGNFIFCGFQGKSGDSRIVLITNNMNEISLILAFHKQCRWNYKKWDTQRRFREDRNYISLRLNETGMMRQKQGSLTSAAFVLTVMALITLTNEKWKLQWLCGWPTPYAEIQQNQSHPIVSTVSQLVQAYGSLKFAQAQLEHII